jgi:hypothetical protein
VELRILAATRSELSTERGDEAGFTEKQRRLALLTSRVGTPAAGSKRTDLGPHDGHGMVDDGRDLPDEAEGISRHTQLPERSPEVEVDALAHQSSPSNSKTTAMAKLTVRPVGGSPRHVRRGSR